MMMETVAIYPNPIGMILFTFYHFFVEGYFVFLQVTRNFRPASGNWGMGEVRGGYGKGMGKGPFPFDTLIYGGADQKQKTKTQ